MCPNAPYATKEHLAGKAHNRKLEWEQEAAEAEMAMAEATAPAGADRPAMSPLRPPAGADRLSIEAASARTDRPAMSPPEPPAGADSPSIQATTALQLWPPPPPPPGPPTTTQQLSELHRKIVNVALKLNMMCDSLARLEAKVEAIENTTQGEAKVRAIETRVLTTYTGSQHGASSTGALSTLS